MSKDTLIFNKEKGNDTLKICIITAFLGEEIYDLIKILSSKYEIYVIYINYPHSIKNSVNIPKPIHLYPVAFPSRSLSLAQENTFKSVKFVPLLINMLIQIQQVIKNNKIDLIVAQWALPSGFLASLCCRNIPLITTLRGSDIKIYGKKKIFSYFVKHSLRRSTKVVALSNDLKREAISLGVKKDKICVIPGGVDTNKFKPGDKYQIRSRLNLPKGIIILYVGNLIKLKRVDNLIKICSTLNQHCRFHLLIIGNGPEEENLKNLVKHLELKNVSFKGWIKYDYLEQYMAASDILCLTSISEGLPQCAQEAMACGLPVVAINVGGLPDLVINGIDGQLVKDEIEMKDCLRQLMAKPEQIQIMGSNASTYAVNNLSLDVVTKRNEELFESVVNRK